MIKSCKELGNYIFSSNIRTGALVGLAALLAVGTTSLTSCRNDVKTESNAEQILESYPTKTIVAKKGDTMSGLVYGSMQGISWDVAKNQFYQDNETYSDQVQAGKAYVVRVGTNKTKRVSN